MRFTISNMPEINPVDFVGGVFPKRQVSIIASEPGCGKTWVMLQTCADLSNGYMFGKFFGNSFGHEERKCMMLVGDTSKEMIVDRINALDLKYISERNFVFYFISDMIAENYPFLLNTEKGRDSIQSLIHYEKPDIVFFDTLISFMTGDENSAKETGEIFIGLRSMAEEENCAIVLNHHLRKTQKGEGHRKTISLNDIIGSSAMARLSALMIGMTRNRAILERNVVNVESVKTWYKEIRSFSFEIISDKTNVSIEPDYYGGNIIKLTKVLEKLADDNDNGQIVTVLDIAEAVRARANDTKAAMMRSPRFTPLTEEPTCDRFIITPPEERGK